MEPWDLQCLEIGKRKRKLVKETKEQLAKAEREKGSEKWQ